MQVSCTESGLSFGANSLEAAGVRLLDSFEVVLPPSSVLLVKGPNGSGKSTLLRGLANQLGEQSLLYKPAFCLRDEFTVRQQAQVFSELGSTQYHDALLSNVGLGDWADDRVGNLSSGQRARLGFLLLDVLNHAKVWLLDEPVNALDFQSIALLRSRLNAHLLSGGVVILAAHLGAEQLLSGIDKAHRFEYQINEGQLHLSVSPQIGQSEQSSGELQSSVSAKLTAPVAAEASPSILSAQTADGWVAAFARERLLALANLAQVFWSGLYLLMTISFFAFALKNPNPSIGLAVFWVGILLALLLTTKDWFFEDLRCGWLGLALNQGRAKPYWLGKIATVWVSFGVTGSAAACVVALFFSMQAQGVLWLVVSLWAGLALAVPLASLIALLVLMTRGGAILVYLLALPLLLPVLVFGLEASGAFMLERSPWSALGVLAGAAALAILVGPRVVVHLLRLIQE